MENNNDINIEYSGNLFIDDIDMSSAKYVGLLFTLEDGSFEARRKAVDIFAKGKEGFDPLLTLDFPCGGSITYDTIDDIPLEDVPCNCGKCKDYFIKYEIINDGR